MGKRLGTTADVIRKMFEMHGAGFSNEEIAKEVNRSVGTVSYYLVRGVMPKGKAKKVKRKKKAKPAAAKAPASQKAPAAKPAAAPQVALLMGDPEQIAEVLKRMGR